MRKTESRASRLYDQHQGIDVLDAAMCAFRSAWCFVLHTSHANAPLAASGPGGRFCRQVSLSNRTLARSGEAAPGAFQRQRGQCRAPRACRWRSRQSPGRGGGSYQRDGLNVVLLFASSSSLACGTLARRTVGGLRRRGGMEPSPMPCCAMWEPLRRCRYTELIRPFPAIWCWPSVCRPTIFHSCVLKRLPSLEPFWRTHKRP
jgi:hypothetical protein